MSKKVLKTISNLVCVLFMLSLFEAPLLAATEAVPVTINGKTMNITPGQWVTVKDPASGATTKYNVRFVDGKPVALDMQQYTSIVFGDSGASAATAEVTSAAQTSKTSKSTSSSSKAKADTTAANNAAESANISKSVETVPEVDASNVSSAESTSGKSVSSSSKSSSKASSSKSSSSKSSTKANNNTAQSSSNTAVDNSSTTQQTAKSTSSKSSSTKTSSWDPAKHPKDPQTGKFISVEEAKARGIIDSDGNLTNQSSSKSQKATSSETGKSSGKNSKSTAKKDSASGSNSKSAKSNDAQINESNSSSETSKSAKSEKSSSKSSKSKSASKDSGKDSKTGNKAASASGEKANASDNSKSGVGSKFKSGYETGKAMTKQGFQNVKDSLKSGFSAKNILVTAGITVGVDLATQVMRGENPSLKTALKTVLSAEFAGSVVGSTVGAAAGSFFVPFLSAIPVVGGVMSALAPTFGSIVGSSVGAYLAGDLKNGRFSIKEAFKRIDWVGVTGQAIGSTVGAALGSFLGPVGTIVGGMAGGYLGNWAAQKIAGMFSKKKSANLPTLPVGYGNGEAVEVTSVTVANSDENIVTNASTSDSEGITIDTESGDAIVTVSNSADPNEAYAVYSELYQQYIKLINENNVEEAAKVAQQMNQAKAEYDALMEASKGE